MARAFKKSVEAGLFELARHGATSNPLLGSILRAKIVNQTLGGAVVGPWDVDLLDDAMLDAIQALAEELPGMKKSNQQVEDLFEKFRKEHPSYRK